MCKMTRRFRGTVACRLSNEPLPPDASQRDKHYHLARTTAERLIRRINQQRIPMCLEHDESNPIGFVVGSHLDQDANMVCDFVIEDEIANDLIDLNDPQLGLRGLSLSHYPESDEPVELSLCLGTKGARVGSRITHEILPGTKSDTNTALHKASPRPYGSIIRASELLSSLPSMSKSLTMIREPDQNQVAYQPNPALNSFFPPEPEQQQQQQQQQEAKDFASASMTDILKTFQPMLQSNISASMKQDMVNAMNVLASRAKDNDSKSKEIEELKRLQQQETLRNRKTLKHFLHSITQKMNGQSIPQEESDELDRIADEGGLDQLSQSKSFLPRLIRASALVFEQLDRQQKQDEMSSSSSSSSSSVSEPSEVLLPQHQNAIEQYHQMLRKHRDECRSGQTQKGYALPAPVQASTISDYSSNKRARPAGNDWDKVDSTLANIVREAQQDTQLNARMNKFARSGVVIPREDTTALKLGQFGFKLGD
jgi:hypothetical protein